MSEWTPDPEERRAVAQLLAMRQRGQDVFLPRSLKELAARATILQQRGPDGKTKVDWRALLPEELVELVTSSSLQLPIGEDFPPNSHELFFHVYPNFRRCAFHIAFTRDGSEELREFVAELIMRDTTDFHDAEDEYFLYEGDAYALLVRTLLTDPNHKMRFMAGETLGLFSASYPAAYFAQFMPQLLAWHDNKSDIEQHGAMCALAGILDVLNDMPTEHVEVMLNTPEPFRRAVAHLAPGANPYTRNGALMAMARTLEHQSGMAEASGLLGVCISALGEFIASPAAAATQGALALLRTLCTRPRFARGWPYCAAAAELITASILHSDWFTLVEAINSVIALNEADVHIFVDVLDRLIPGLVNHLQLSPVEMTAQHIGVDVDTPAQPGIFLDKDEEWTRRRGALAALEGLLSHYEAHSLAVLMNAIQPLLTSRVTREHEAGLLALAIAGGTHTAVIRVNEVALWGLFMEDVKSPQAVIRSAVWLAAREMSLLDTFIGLTSNESPPYMPFFDALLRDVVCNDQRCRRNAIELLSFACAMCRNFSAVHLAQRVIIQICLGIERKIFQREEWVDVWALVDLIISDEVNDRTEPRLFLSAPKSDFDWVAHLNAIAFQTLCTVGMIGPTTVFDMTLYSSLTLLLELLQVSRVIDAPQPVIPRLHRLVRYLHELVEQVLLYTDAHPQLMVIREDDPITYLDLLHVAYHFLGSCYGCAMTTSLDDEPEEGADENSYIHSHLIPIEGLLLDTHRELFPKIAARYPNETYLELYWGVFSDMYTSMRKNRHRAMPMPTVSGMNFHAWVLQNVCHLPPTENAKWMLVEMMRLQDIPLDWPMVRAAVDLVTGEMIGMAEARGKNWVNAGTFISLIHERFPSKGFLLTAGCAPMLKIFFKVLRPLPTSEGDEEDQDDTMRGLLGEFLRVSETTKDLPVTYEDGMSLINLLRIKRREHFTLPTVTLILKTLDVARRRVPVPAVREAIDAAAARYEEGFVPDAKHEAEIDAELEAEARAAEDEENEEEEGEEREDGGSEGAGDDEEFEADEDVTDDDDGDN